MLMSAAAHSEPMDTIPFSKTSFISKGTNQTSTHFLFVSDSICAFISLQSISWHPTGRRYPLPLEPTWVFVVMCRIFFLTASVREVLHQPVFANRKMSNTFIRKRVCLPDSASSNWGCGKTQHHPDLSCRFSGRPWTLWGQSPSMRHWSQMPTFQSVIAEGITFLYPLAHNGSPLQTFHLKLQLLYTNLSVAPVTVQLDMYFLLIHRVSKWSSETN